MRLSPAAIYEELLVQIGDLDQMPDVAGAILANLSQCRLLLGDLPAAESRARHALWYSKRHSDFGPSPLHVMATVAALRGQAVPAGRLSGYVDEWYRGRGYVRTLSDRAALTPLLVSLKGNYRRSASPRSPVKAPP